MSDAFCFSRGCVYKVTAPDGRDSAGTYKLQGLSKGSDTSPILITGIEVQDQDMLAAMATLNGHKILYVFGQDFGNIGVGGVVLLGAAGATSNSFGLVTQWFNTWRMSAQSAPATVTIAGKDGYKFYPSKLVIGAPEPETNIQPFAIMGYIADPPKGN